MTRSSVAEYVWVIRHRWRWMVWGVLIALGLTTAALLLQPPTYRSDATVFVRTPGDVSQVVDGGDFYAQGRAKTYAALAISPSVSARVVHDLGLDLQPESLSARIKATNPPGTALVDVSVSAPSAAEAQRTAAVFLNEYAATVRQLESIPGSLVPRAELVVVDPPAQATRVIGWGTSVPVLLLGSALLGLLLGATAAVIRSTFDDRAAHQDDAPSETDDNEKGERVTLRKFVSSVRQFRLTFLIVAAAVFVVGITSILLLPGRYVSSTRLLVSVEGSTTASAYQNDSVATRRVASYLPLLTSGVVTQRVIDKLALPLSPSELADEISVANVPPKTSLIDIEVIDASPDRAKRIADTLANEFITYAASIETPTGEDSHKVDVKVVTPAAEGRENRMLPVLLGVLAGMVALVLASVAVWVRAAREPAGSDGDGETVAEPSDPVTTD